MTSDTDHTTARGEIQVRFCRASLLVGLLVGALAAGGSVGAAWFGVTLAERAEITKDLLTRAKCDETVVGWSSIVFADGSQYTCTPRQMQPPTSRKEAAARRGR
jgi:hypothetical protein